MRKALVTILILLFASCVMAQSKGVILIRSSEPNKPTSFTNLLKSYIATYYNGEIVVKSELLTDTLSRYDAVFITEHMDITFISNEVERINEYLLNGGNVFFDLAFIEALTYRSNPHIIDSFPQFSQLTGIENLAFGLTQIQGVLNIYGINSTFTQGLYVKEQDDRFKVASEGYASLGGRMKSILRADASPSVNIAWAFEEGNHKSVTHWHIAENHLPRFIGLTLCNYFNLCTPLSVGNDIASASFEITNPTYIRDRNELLFSYQSPSVTKFDISVYNILGERVYYSYDNDASSTSSEMQIRLNGRLASGGYFLVIKTADGVARKPFFVIN